MSAKCTSKNFVTHVPYITPRTKAHSRFLPRLEQCLQRIQRLQENNDDRKINQHGKDCRA